MMSASSQSSWKRLLMFRSCLQHEYLHLCLVCTKLRSLYTELSRHRSCSTRTWMRVPPQSGQKLSLDKRCFVKRNGGKPVCVFFLHVDDILVAWAPGYDSDELRHATNIKWGSWEELVPGDRSQLVSVGVLRQRSDAVAPRRRAHHAASLHSEYSLHGQVPSRRRAGAATHSAAGHELWSCSGSL